MNQKNMDHTIKKSDMKKGDIVEALVLETRFPNKGMAEIIPPEGKNITAEAETVTVKNVLPGQKIRLRITKKRKGKAEGTLLEVIEPSPAETESDCPHFPACGGCMMRTLPYGQQLELKAKQVRQILEPVCPGLPFEGVLPSPDITGYRNKMEFSFGDAEKDGPLQLGLHRKGSFYDILTTDECRIVDADFRLILKTVLNMAERYALTYYHKVAHQGYLRHLLIRKGRYTGEILAALVTSSDHTGFEADFETGFEEGAFLAELTESLCALPLSGTLTGFLHIRNDSVSDTITPESMRTLFGRDFFFEKLGTLTFRISPFSFFQTNTAGAKVLYDKVCEYASVREGMNVFDLYSGTGTIAQMLASTASHVTGVEIVEEAVEAARENAALNHLSNCSFIVGDVLKVVDELTQKPDMIILDPPRDGIHPKALPKIIGFDVERIVYISCKVTSLARDLPAFLEAGYTVERCCCVDMFPGTGHVETVVLMSRVDR